MFTKAFFIYSLVVGALLIVAGLYLLLFDHKMHEGFGNTKTMIMAFASMAYGGFRVWRAYKMNKSGMSNE
jgi:hypothetical protein